MIKTPLLIIHHKSNGYNGEMPRHFLRVIRHSLAMTPLPSPLLRHLLTKLHFVGRPKKSDMACSLSHIIDEIKALVEKLIDEDIVRQKAIIELAVQFDNASTTKDDLRKTYEKCNDIPQENRALIETFLKQESDKDYEMHLALFRKSTKIKQQMNNKFV
ncbi:hypothetical protein Tco_0303575 [Tanacetum coccineum]